MATEKDKADAEALQLLEQASKQFEAYLKIAASAQTFLEPHQDSEQKPDWTHPMGLVLASSR